MGVSGAGKTTVGRALADSLGWKFYEGDDFHPQHNIDLMSRGHPLTDQDRAPWLDALRELIGDVISRGDRAVLACSALRHVYRVGLIPRGADPEDVRFVFLDVPPDVLRERLELREGHFAPPELLDSQLSTLEKPGHAFTVDGTLPPADIVTRVRSAIGI